MLPSKMNLPIVRINVGGAIFQTYRSTLLKIPDSTIAEALRTNSHYNEHIGCFFFDRSPEYFSLILKAYRKGLIHLPDDVCGLEVLDELEYWKVPLTIIAPCCMIKIRKELRDHVIAIEVREQIFSDFDKSLDALSKSTGWMVYRIRLWMFLQIPAYSTWAKVWSLFMATVIVASLFMFAAHFDHTMSSVDVKDNKSMVKRMVVKLIDTEKWREIWLRAPSHGILITDGCLNGIILVDFVMRFLLCPYKRYFMKYFCTILDIIVILSYWAGMIMYHATYYGKEKSGELQSKLQWIWLVSLSVQLLRPFRLFGLGNTFLGLRILLTVIRKSVYDLSTVLICFVIGMIVFAFLIFAAEIGVEDTFHTIWDGCWWSVITMTTVGYGDMYPKAWPGYLVAMACAMSGIIITGLSIPILSNNFNTYYQHVHLANAELRKRFNVLHKGDNLQVGVRPVISKRCPITLQQI